MAYNGLLHYIVFCSELRHKRMTEKGDSLTKLSYCFFVFTPPFVLLFRIYKRVTNVYKYY